MNAKQFKQLIKECVKEAVREELVELFSQPQPKKKIVKENFSFNSSDIMAIKNKNQLAERMQAEFGHPGMKESQGSDYKLKQASIPQSVIEGNPLAAFIADAAANMSAEDVAGIRNL
jgi:hypothetical protein